MRAEREHHLLSLPIPGGYLHAYVITNDPRRILEPVLNKLYDIAESQFGGASLPISLDTKLDRAAATKLRRLLWERAPETKPLMLKATTFHMSSFAMAADNPDNQWLMDLH